MHLYNTNSKFDVGSKVNIQRFHIYEMYVAVKKYIYIEAPPAYRYYFRHIEKKRLTNELNAAVHNQEKKSP